MTLPSTMKAIKILPDHKAGLKDVPLPKLRDGYVLCKVNAVALNPTDWKHIDFVGKEGSTVGVDFSGIVEEVGNGVTKTWKKGDRIAGFVHGGNEAEPEDGAFGEYCVVKGDIAFKIPDSMSFEDAASLNTGVITCGQALYQSLGLPLPESGKYGGYLLVYGGSTATGTLAIQYGVLSGCKVIATASKHNWPLLKSLGAEEVFDYNDPECSKKIRAHTSDSLTLALDCIAEGNSPKICEEAISTKGGAITYLLPTQHTRSDVENKQTLGYTITGEEFNKFGKHFPASLEDFEHAKMFWALSEELIHAGHLTPHPVEARKGGLDGVFGGLQDFREGKVSGKKLVYAV
ncbi:zinc-binding oxidoreductase ToxD like protein [Zymoseptoria brevis]|uniref:Zinc-binding oxidoreductase ToxD like protein n=1 Tax=Zymoseptoria brevis TaxID=1047168 RepID=A0A0F4GI93_9PEZI|nr:zinc-binding oxidoreductase ToxD like protein [Zymoseptoria brevis]